VSERDWNENRCYVPRTGAYKGEHTKQYCVFNTSYSTDGKTLWVQGCRADGTHVQVEALRIPVECVEELIAAMQYQMAGPLGKLAITNDLTTTVMENDA
jgi:hypothetical protein